MCPWTVLCVAGPAGENKVGLLKQKQPHRNSILNMTSGFNGNHVKIVFIDCKSLKLLETTLFVLR